MESLIRMRGSPILSTGLRTPRPKSFPGASMGTVGRGRPASTLALALRTWPLPQGFTGPTVDRLMAQRKTGFFHLHLVSDATGETLITVARAAAAQYATISPIEHVYPLVRTAKQLERVLTEIESSPGIVLYTLLDPELTERLEGKCRELGLPCRSILGPGAAHVPILPRDRNDAPRRRPALAQCRIFQAHRCAQLHDAA